MLLKFFRAQLLSQILEIVIIYIERLLLCIDLRLNIMLMRVFKYVCNPVPNEISILLALNHKILAACEHTRRILILSFGCNLIKTLVHQ